MTVSMNMAIANQASISPGFNALQMQAASNQLAPDATAPVASGGWWVHDLSPIAWHIELAGFNFDLRWYSLAYLAGIVLGWVYMLKLLKQPGAPMARRHADDFVFYVTLGIILGGRLGYVLFYRPLYYMEYPLDIVKLWDGGMSFHGGLIGSTVAVLYLARANGLSFLRVGDYACCCAPFGLFFGRLANFVNGELWGGITQVPWAVRFREVMVSREGSFEIIGPPRHPSQLYEAGLEGLLLAVVLAILFWGTRARYKPGFLAGAFIFGYGLCRFAVEFFRLPDAHLREFTEITHLSMGQWLSVPMLLLGLYLMLTARKRDPIYAEAQPEPAAEAEAPTGEPPAEPA